MSQALRIVLSGCSGGGKSTLLDGLAERGFQTMPEPGRRVVQEGIDPASDLIGFATRAAELARDDFERADPNRPCFFDRSAIDAARALKRAGHNLPETVSEALAACQYSAPVFLTPPWASIYITDAERTHGFDAAVEEYEDLAKAYPDLGYQTLILPKVSVEARIAFVLDALDLSAP